jgi:hypothetical protein
VSRKGSAGDRRGPEAETWTPWAHSSPARLGASALVAVAGPLLPFTGKGSGAAGGVCVPAT